MTIEPLIEVLPIATDKAASGNQAEDEEAIVPPADHALLPFPVAALPKAMHDLIVEGAEAICCPQTSSE